MAAANHPFIGFVNLIFNHIEEASCPSSKAAGELSRSRPKPVGDRQPALPPFMQSALWLRAKAAHLHKKSAARESLSAFVPP